MWTSERGGRSEAGAGESAGGGAVGKRTLTEHLPASRATGAGCAAASSSESSVGEPVQRQAADSGRLEHDLAASLGFLGGPAPDIETSIGRMEPPAPRDTVRSYRVRTSPDGSANEITVAPPGGGEEESTTGGGGTGSDGGTGSGGTGTTGGGSVTKYYECKPTSAAIKNVTKYNSGKLYGHEFDFEVGLTYTELASGATANKDATLEWWEKTTRPPAWQTAITANTWNDMFALYPTSPTFDGWTKNRTKPMPGSEVAKIHDPPAASVDMPARTLSFNLKVKGGGDTKAATGEQVLEPDGKGGIKTQTFT